MEAGAQAEGRRMVVLSGPQGERTTCPFFAFPTAAPRTVCSARHEGANRPEGDGRAITAADLELG